MGLGGEKSESLVKSGEYVSDSETSSCYNNYCRIVKKQQDHQKKACRIVQKQQDHQKAAATKAKWKEEVVIVLLEAVIQFQQQQTAGESKVTSNYYKRAAYYDFIKTRLWQGISTSQIYEKLRNLNVNFVNTNKKLETNLQELNPYDTKVFQLSQKIWGTTTTTTTTSSLLVEKQLAEEKKQEMESSCPPPSSQVIERYWDIYPYMYQSVDSTQFALRDHLYLLGDKNGKKYDSEWMYISLDEEELRQKMDQLQYDQTLLILNAIKNTTTAT